MRPSTAVAALAAVVALVGNASECDVARGASEGVSAASIQGSPLSGSALGKEIVRQAEAARGTAYSWGGGDANGPSYGIDHGSSIFGFDCSGLVQYAIYQATNGAVKWPRVSQDQAKAGKAVSRENMRPGDIIAFDHGEGFTHIGIYIGSGKFVHAPQTGDVVRISSLSSRKGQRWAIRRVA
uniref:C40 family peptidase n=1 Tax=Nonomuraea sp. CA-251285 TaxID=3240002 RepID=UPI003F4978F7